MSARDAQFSLRAAEDQLQEPSVEELAAAVSGSELDESRYELVRKLGEGGAGVVYLVRDRETGEALALKRLLHVDIKSVLRLKREFRSVADIHHPNLVKLYDLGHSQSGWFFTMEYIDGIDLMTYVRAQPSHTRLVAAFQQLASGVHALHRAGMLHRDLKPRNVLVGADRLRVLDFGLARSLDDASVVLTAEGMITGTPAYMAPEQALGAELSQATDWYAFGVMLYEAISGKLPFEGALAEVLHNKVERDPLSLAQLTPEAPVKLRELCMALLRRNPEERPRYDEIAAVLAPQPTTGFTSLVHELETAANDQTSRRSLADALFGRSQELERLSAALAEARAGNFVVTHVRGVSGSGKSALISTFLDRIERKVVGPEDTEVLVLRSRCYEREAMPFKALDGLIDALVHYLEKQDDLTVSYVLPLEVNELARVFPTLERLRVVRRLLEQRKLRVGATQERKLAELALRNLLLRLVTQRPIVLWIDDLQWGDLDSANILKSWVESLESASVLLLLSYRSDEQATSACLRTLAEATPSASVREQAIELRALHAVDVEALCVERLGEASGLMSPLIARIVEEAQGSPFFASQLLTLAQAKLAHGETDLQTLSVEGVVTQASQLLSPTARRLLSVLAIAGRPLPMQVAFRAAELWQGGRSLLHDLRNLRLTRTRVVGDEKLIEIYHDRVREGVLAALGPEEKKSLHRDLLRAVAAGGGDDPDLMFVLAAGAGEHESALRFGLQAAERANKALAFERAADVYQQCIELSEMLGGTQSAEIWIKLATALGLCRRGARAAEAYLEAASRGSAERSVELLRLAATHLLRSGRFEEGQSLVNRVLAALKLSVPSSEAGLFAAIAWEELRLRARGIRFTPRRKEEVSPQLLAAMSTYGVLSIDLQAIDPLRAALFQARCMRTALDTGVPSVVASALCGRSTSACLSGSIADGERAAALLERAESLAAEDPVVSARVLTARALCALLLGRPAQVVESADRAELSYRALVRPDGKIAGEDYHRVALAVARTGALLQTGRTRDAIAGLRSEEEAARVTGDRTASLQLTLVATIADQVEARFKESRPRLMLERAELPQQVFGPLHMMHITAVMWAGCVDGEGEWADELVQQDWPRFLRSVVRRSAYLSTLAYGAHARFVLNRHIAKRSSEHPEALIRDDLRALDKLPSHLGQQVVAGLRARLAFLAGDRARAAALLLQQNDLYTRAGSLNEAAFGRLALGRIAGGAEGDAICREAEQALRELGFVDPSSILPLHFPELQSRSVRALDDDRQ